MSGSAERVLADTSVISALLAGDPIAGSAILGRSVCISVITELELLSNPVIIGAALSVFKVRLRSLPVVEMGQGIRIITIALRRERLLKLPDAIIAASAIALGVPLVTADKRFLKVSDRLDVRLLKLSR